MVPEPEQALRGLADQLDVGIGDEQLKIDQVVGAIALRLGAGVELLADLVVQRKDAHRRWF
jgi:hypothetical protein